MKTEWKEQFPKEHRYFETENGILYLGNAISLLNSFPKESIDLIVTSPPYDNLRTYKNIEWNFDIFKQIAKGLSRVLKHGGVIVWVVGDATINGSETGTSFKQALYFKEQCNLRLHDTMIYERSGLRPDPTRYWNVFQYMFVLSKGKPKAINFIKDRLNKQTGKKKTGAAWRNKEGVLTQRRSFIVDKYSKRTNIWKYNTGYNLSTKDKIAFEHPAIFPEQLAIDHIKSWSNEGDIVLDPFMGSGTTAKAAELLNRKWVGIEINPEYCEITKQRLENYHKEGI